MTSPDGITWTSRTSAADNNWQSITYGNGTFVAVAWSGTGNRIMTSPDGINWTIRTSAADNMWLSVTYGNGLFVAVSNSGTGNRVMTSPDGITWTSRTYPVDNSWQSVTYGNGLFVAVSTSGTGNRVMTSPDGINWTIRTSAADLTWNSVTYGNGLFVAVSFESPGSLAMTSPDGITWTTRSIVDKNYKSVTYGNGLFAAVAGTSCGSSCVTTSPDGITWTVRNATSNYWQSVTYGNGIFVAISTSCSGDCVLISTSTTPTTTAGAGQVTVNYITPQDSDLNSVVILRSTSAITDVPVDGTTYTGGETIGAATVACVDTTVTASTTDSCVSTGLTNGTSYYFKVFAKDLYGNYSSGLVPTGSPVTPVGGTTPPTVTTSAASSITATTAILNGNITADNGASSTIRGFAWGTVPTLVGGDTATTTQTGTFGISAFSTSTLTFTCNTSYYSRAYAVNSAGTSTGAISGPFTTSACPTTTIANGVDPSTTTIAPGSSATSSSAFTFQTSAGTDVISAVVVGFAAGTASSTSLVEITNDAGSTVYGSTTNPTSDTPTITLNNNTLTATNSSVQYKIRITPKSQAN